MMWWFTGCEHYWHSKILEYTGRPYTTVRQMNNDFRDRHNAVVGKRDITVHVGDFWFNKRVDAWKFIRTLNGNHIFLRGDHDRWLKKSHRKIWTKGIEGQRVVACHWPFASWPSSIHGSWNVFSHPHGRLRLDGFRYDVSVDNNNFYPVSFERLAMIMEKKSHEKKS
jgi:calcineurin-like phosphoesterase family protein